MSTVETYSFVGVNVPSIRKAPGDNAKLDYTFNWTEWLAADADSIVSATLVLDGVTLVSQTDVFPRVRCKVRGGVAGQTATIACTIVTAQGRTDTRTIFLLIRVR